MADLTGEDEARSRFSLPACMPWTMSVDANYDAAPASRPRVHAGRGWKYRPPRTVFNIFFESKDGISFTDQVQVTVHIGSKGRGRPK
jgi:hypothetical protein